MVRLFVLLFTLLALNGAAATYYVAPATASPAGNDANSGDKLHPWASWEKAFTSRLPGDTVIFRGGVYPTTVTNGSGITKTITGTAAKWVVFMNYPGEKPILDCSNVTATYYGTNYGMRLSGSFYKLVGLTVRNVWQINAVEPAELCYAFRTTGNDFTLENCTAHNTHGSGFWPHGTNVHFINCDSYDHCDSRTLDGHMPGNNGYGYFHYNTGTTGSIYYKDCRAWDCGDDGWALADNSYVEIDGCWSFRNGRLEGGGNGFKIGFIPQASSIPLLRVVKNSIAAFNRASGLTTNDNNNYTIAPANIYNNVAYHNGYYPEWKNPVYGFYLYNTTGTEAQELQRVFRNNISYANQASPVGDGYYHDVPYTHSHNSWDISGLTVSDGDFLSVDSTGISGPRQADGSLPALNFLKLAPASNLIDRGTDVGIPFTGTAPDLGIAEQATTLLPPVAAITAPATTILTCKVSVITLTATGGVSYSWSDGTKVVGTSASLTITQPATYTVTVTSAGGLTATAHITITEDKTPPVVTITNNTGTTALTCNTSVISVTASGGTAYSWSDGSKVVSTAATLNITARGTYTVTATGSNGCTAAKAITITEDKTPPVVTITNNTGTTALTCNTSVISVTASGGTAYSWSDGSKVVSTAATLNITARGTYTVTATGTNGCTAAKAITITEEITPPVVTITNNTGTTILDATTPTISVTAAGGIAYSWSDGSKVIATTADLTITWPATYTVTVTGANGCSANKSLNIIRQVETLPAPVVSVTQPECGDTGGAIRVTDPAPGTGYTYSINGSDYSNISGLFTGVAAGIFQVTAKNSSGTISPATVVTVNPIPEGNIVPLFDIFGPYPEGSEAVTLPQLSNNGITGSWSPSTISTTLPGNYTFIFTPDEGQCAVSIQISIDILKAEVAGTPRLTRQISAGSDDVEERIYGSVVTNSDDLELVYDNYSTGNQVIGLRFNDITIPAQATVTSAYIQFTVAETTYGTTRLRVYGQKTDHALPFTTAKKNVSRRPRTSASVPWAPAPLGGSAVGSRTEAQRTADLSPILQEILTRTGWDQGNSMAFIITGYGKRNAVSYEGSRNEAAELVVEYTLPATAVTAAAPTATTALPVNTLALETGITRGEISCYPVPFREILHIRYQPGAGEESSMMGLYDLAGRLLKTLDHQSPHQNIATGDLPPGMYLLRVDTNTGGIVQKVVKQ